MKSTFEFLFQNVRHLNGLLNISLEIFPKKTKKRLKILGKKNVILEILIPSINEGNFYGNSEISVAMFKTGTQISKLRSNFKNTGHASRGLTVN